ncbi:MAG TPA: type I 3-dehydroquinate dehydratase [Planctomycetota bacterium]|nr:type I 3-dehydroquinate dehydratase [Planctomycetota bacterium]
MNTQLVATLMPRTPSEAAATLRAPPAGADFVELRLDALQPASAAAVSALLALPRSIPVIATCRTGGSVVADSQRLGLLAHAGESGAELLDVDDTLLPQLPDSVPGERLASCHVAHFVPRLASLAKRIAGQGTRLCKLAVPAGGPRQLAELLALQEQLGSGFAIVPTGRLAETGRVLVAGRGAALSYGAVDPERRGHPDQPSVARLHEVFGLGTVGPSTRFFAIVARPAAHSLSPAFHNAVFHAVGQDSRMVTLDVDRLADVLELADVLRLDGLAVSHPFKREALALATSALPGAQATGAANTLLRTRSPAGWQARNTDWKAACDLLPRLLKAWRREHAGQTPRVLLLGSGGAARAVAVSLVGEDIELAVWSRRLSNARELCTALEGALPATAVPDPGHFPADVLVNATPVGTPGSDPGELRLDAGNFRSGALAVDLAYGAESSPFRSAAREAQAQLTSGEDFFCLQARRQAELFTGAPVPEAVRELAARRCGLAR